MNQSYELPLTEEEIEAIGEYAGLTHAKINFLADLDYNKQQQLKKDNWIVEMKTEELEKNIQRFVNIYSAIYKAGKRTARKGLYKATNKEQIEEIKRKGEMASFTSTSFEEDDVKTKYFGGYQDDAVILRINVEENVPTLYIDPYKNGAGEDEEEVLISPFTKVKHISKRENGKEEYAYYDVTLEKEELEEVPESELRALQAQLIEGYDYYKEQVKISMELENRIQYLYGQLQTDEGREVQKLKETDLNEAVKQYSHTIKTVQEYQQQFKRMMRGLCKEKELEIDKQREEVRIQKIEERKIRDEEHLNQLEAEIATFKQQIRNGKTNIVDMLEQYIGEMEEISKKYRTIAEDLKVDYSQDIHFKVLEMIQNIKTTLETTEETNESQQPSQEENEDYKTKRDRLQDVYGDLLKQKKSITEIQQIMQELPQYVREHEKHSAEEIKANLNAKIQEMIAKERVSQLQTEKQKISQEKESKLQRLFYGTTLKEQKIANIDAKIELEQKQAKTRNPNNLLSVMMEELYECRAQDLQGEFSPEMLEVIYTIRRNFDNVPNEEMLSKQACQKTKDNYPITIGNKRPSKRQQINYYRQDTDRIKFEIYDSTYHKKPIREEVQSNPLSKFEGTISRIERKLKGEESTEKKDYQVDLDIK